MTPATSCASIRTSSRTRRSRGTIPNWRNTPHSNTPSLRVAAFEDEDEDDDDEDEGPCEVARSAEDRRYRKQPKIDALRQYKEEILEAHARPLARP